MVKYINSKNLVNMHNAYMNCYNLTGNPECGPFVTDMTNAYANCYNLTGYPVIGPNVTNMSNAYANCYSLTGSPMCAPNVTDMSGAYYNCSNLIGITKCGPVVTNMANTYYNCRNLSGQPAIGPMVTNLYSSFYNCRGITGIVSLYSPNVENVVNCFYGRSNADKLYLLTLNNSSTFNSIYTSTGVNSIVGTDLSWSNGWSFSNTSNCHFNKVCNINMYSGNNIAQMEYDLATVVARYSTVSLSNDPTFNTGFRYTVTNTYNNATRLYDHVVRSNNPGVMPSYMSFDSVTDKLGREITKVVREDGYVSPIATVNEYDTMPLRDVSYYGTIVTFNYGNFCNATNLYHCLSDHKLLLNIQPEFWDLPKVTELSHAFGTDFIDLQHAIVNAPNAVNMVSTYYWCGDLLGSPLCGDKVRNMALCYCYCNSITGNPVCGPNVVDMRSAYYGCHMLTGSPAVGPNVINMASAYSGCTNLTGNIKFGPNVTVIDDAYNGCIHLTGTPYCPDAATNMAQTYRNCRNLTGNPVCGPNVTNMSYAYQDCTNLTGKPIFGNKVTNVAYTYANCPNVAQGNAYFIPTNMTSIAGCFMGKNNSKRLNVFVQANSSTYNLCMNNSRYYSLVYDDITWTNAGKYNYNIAYNIYVYAETNVQATMESNEDPTLIAVYTTTNTSMRTVPVAVNSSYTAEVSGNTVRLTSLTADSVTYINFCDKQDLTGIQTLRPSILDLHQSFQNCRNLTGEPWCGPNVSNLFRTYENCINLTGSPVCSDLVVNMESAYYNCTNLTGSPVCGANVTDMSNTYWNCQNLTGSPVVGPNVTSMTETYFNCRNLTGSSVCGDKVVSLSATYANCVNLTSGVIGPNVVNMEKTFVNCHNITNVIVLSNKVTNAWNSFNGRSNAKRLNVYVPTTGSTLNTFLWTNNSSIMGKSISWTNASSYYYNTRDNVYIYPISDMNTML